MDVRTTGQFEKPIFLPLPGEHFHQIAVPISENAEPMQTADGLHSFSRRKKCANG
jgi:hypothetical protein